MNYKSRLLSLALIMLTAIFLVSCGDKKETTFDVVFQDWNNVVLDTQKVGEGK
ncbi:hypothetical protein IY230_02170, partial [Acholeplasma laidlawii]|nr:hypothetical protein [Acholeplasma laidlawii]